MKQLTLKQWCWHHCHTQDLQLYQARALLAILTSAVAAVAAAAAVPAAAAAGVHPGPAQHCKQTADGWPMWAWSSVGPCCRPQMVPWGMQGRVHRGEEYGFCCLAQPLRWAPAGLTQETAGVVGAQFASHG